MKALISLVIGTLFLCCCVSTAQPPKIDSRGTTAPIFIQTTDAIDRINDYQVKHNLLKLQMDQTLNNSACEKSGDMYTKSYFGHSKYFESIFNKKWKVMGEILGKGYKGKELMSAWLKSKMHKKVIDNPKFTSIGSCEVGEYTTVHFGATNYILASNYEI